VAVWNLQSGDRLATLTEADPAVSPAFDPSGRFLAVAGRDNSAHVYQLDTSGETRRLAHLEPVTSLAFSPDGRRVATGSADGSIRVWDLASGESLGFRGPDDGPKAVVFSPTGPLLASAEQGVVRLWGLGMQDSREELVAPGFDAESLEFSRNGLELAAVAGGRFMLWDMPARKQKLARRLNERIVDIRQSPEGDWLALTLDSDGKLHVWDAERQREVASLANAQALTARFSGETLRVAAAGLDGRVTLWESSHVSP
jgi:WD40 repeat protein